MPINLVKAARLSRGLKATADHFIGSLVEELPDGPLRTALERLPRVEQFATTFRYPSMHWDPTQPDDR